VSELLNLILLGLIEGITEFLPISSTGHLLIAEHWLGHRSDLFNVTIQSGAILAVVLIYRQRLWQLATGLGDAKNRDYALKLGVAFVITAVLGLIATKLGFKLPETVTPVAWALILGGVWMVGAEWLAAKQPDRSEVTWLVAILVGIAQVVAGIFPGTSRSAATIFVAMLAGTSNRSAATEFSFLLGIPTMFAASAYAIYKDAPVAGEVHTPTRLVILGTVVSAIVAFIVVRWLLRFVQSHTFVGFGWYRIALGLIMVAVALR
jgi:undecaprenyl-diphosphatase